MSRVSVESITAKPFGYESLSLSFLVLVRMVESADRKSAGFTDEPPTQETRERCHSAGTTNTASSSDVAVGARADRFDLK
jgi:hypothetical protein